MLAASGSTLPASNTAVAPKVTLVLDFPDRCTTNTISITPTMRAITTDITIPVGRFIFRSIPGPGPQRSSPDVQRPYRVIVAKPGLDGHDRGAKVIARALRDAGFEVIYTGLHQTPEQVVQAVIQEDADAVGLSLLSGAHMTLFPRVIDLLKERGRDDVLVFGGGIIPEADIPELKKLGVAEIFTPGATMASITEWLERALDER